MVFLFKKYGLRRLSLQLMELLWVVEKPLSYDEIFALAKSRWGQKRKIRKLESCLYDLQKAGAIIRNEILPFAHIVLRVQRGNLLKTGKKNK